MANIIEMSDTKMTLAQNPMIGFIATIIGFITPFISGFSKAICDLSEEGKLKFNPENYWLKAKSWRSKYKQNNPILGAKFLGSTTVFVALTDAWHLFHLININPVENRCYNH